MNEKRIKLRLKHITFTGVDAKTNLKVLDKIQKKYPMAEFGVLTSYHWYENGNRYLDPSMIGNLGDNLNLALHVCGKLAHNAATGRWGTLDLHLDGQLNKFRRIQLNIAEREDNPKRVCLPMYSFQEIVIQTKNSDKLDIYKETVNMYNSKQFSTLIDASGGCGIDTPLKVCHSKGKIGYAGGINPDNVADKLRFLLKNISMGEFWIDMESGVRTDDWFDIDKVEDVLKTCRMVLDEMDIK